MACKLRQRKDDIPKFGKEKSWECEKCNALMFAPRKPVCRAAMLAQVQARHASAEAEADSLDLDHKVKP
jgi:hypothetical protein